MDRSELRTEQFGVISWVGRLFGVNKFEKNAVQRFGEAVDTRYRCPCCGYKTLETAGAMALCPICWWEDDGQEDEDAGEIRLTVNGHLSLNEAREHFSRCGAAHPRFLPYVRKPQVTDQ
jgi:hypothetical protein